MPATATKTKKTRKTKTAKHAEPHPGQTPLFPTEAPAAAPLQKGSDTADSTIPEAPVEQRIDAPATQPSKTPAQPDAGGDASNPVPTPKTTPRNRKVPDTRTAAQKEEAIRERVGRITEKYEEVKQSEGAAVFAWHDIGWELVHVKEDLPHGDWLPWLKANVEFSKRKATDSMTIYRDWKYIKPHLEASGGVMSIEKALDYAKTKGKGSGEGDGEGGSPPRKQPTWGDIEAQVMECLVRAGADVNYPDVVAIFEAVGLEPKNVRRAMNPRAAEDAPEKPQPQAVDQPLSKSKLRKLREEGAETADTLHSTAI